MRLVRLSDEYVVNLDELREAIFQSATVVTSSRLYLYVGNDCTPTVLEDDRAIAAWCMLRDLCESPGRLRAGHDARMNGGMP